MLLRAVLGAVTIRLVIWAFFGDVLYDSFELTSPPVGSLPELVEDAYRFAHQLPIGPRPPLLAACLTGSLPIPQLIVFASIVADLCAGWALMRLLKHAGIQHWRDVVLLWLYNPISILTALSGSLGSIMNAIQLLVLMYAMIGSSLAAGWFLALGSYAFIYPVFLVVPACCFLKSKHKAFLFIGTALISFAALNWLSAYITGSFQFIESYIQHLSVNDLTPNIGFYWYFFTQIFPQFREFFVWALIAQPVFMIGPFYTRFRKYPLFFTFCVGTILYFYKPYPVFADLNIPIALFAAEWPLIGKNYRRILILGCAFAAVCVGLGSIMRFLWMNTGAGHANFYYFPFLVCNAFLMVLFLEAITSVRLQEKDKL